MGEARRPPKCRTAGAWGFDAVFGRIMMIQEILAIALITAGMGLLGWVISAPDRALLALPIIAGELSMGLWLCFLRPGGGERG